MSVSKLALAVCASAALVTAQRVDASQDFGLDRNPNGVWNYGATTSTGLNFARFSAKSSSTCLAKSSWGVNALSALSVGKNMSGKDLRCGNVVYPSDALALHPSARGERAVLRWIAPKDGQHRVLCEFVALDRASSDVHVSRGGQDVFAAKLTGKGQWRRFSQTLSVYKGEAIDFAVGSGGNGNIGDVVALRVSIEAAKGWKLIGSGCKGSGGLTPAVSFSGSTEIGSRDFTLLLSNALGGRGVVAGLVIGRSETHWNSVQLPLPLNNACTLVAAPDVIDFVLVSGASGAGKGSARVPMPIPNCGCMVDQTFFFQWFVLDPAQKPVALSNTLRLILN